MADDRYYLTFNGGTSSASAVAGSGPDNIWRGRSTIVDFWAKVADPTVGGIQESIITKVSGLGGGWIIGFTDLGFGFPLLYASIEDETGLGGGLTVAVFMASPDEWYHYAVAYNDTGDRQIYFALNGMWFPGLFYVAQSAATGVLADDSAENLYLGSYYTGSTTLDGSIEWARISTGARWEVGTDFTPPERTTIPPIDAHTIEQWSLEEGNGNVAHAQLDRVHDLTLTDCTWETWYTATERNSMRTLDPTVHGATLAESFAENAAAAHADTTAEAYFKQASTTGAVPVLTVEQCDVSEELVRFVGTSTTDNSQSLVDAANLTTPGAVVGWIKVYIQDDAVSGAITDGVYWIPFYATPTS